ncbi:hypothetical protein QR680_004901 [Steinernema hermaphroditum]|uniref:Lipase n=1 Tax=Steinernema hermaphroditum TaxID=289476 RepID=A0AA39HRF2_9BILA|nr:hypothetical protein QR680_004901 [Steinernema hermaphroditum]
MGRLFSSPSLWPFRPSTQKLANPDIISHWGYPAETFYATTQDGYILTVHRIPFGKNDQPSDKPKPVVFLQHGLLANSNNWITNLPHLALGYILADAGYDVWMGNVRGNVYSMDHTTLNPKGHEFWRFSFDEMARYDLDAMIDKALAVSNHKSLFYVGHSQGTAIMFVKLSQDHAFSQKIRKFYALAPVATAQHVKGVCEFIAHDLYKGIEWMYNAFGVDQFLPDSPLLKGLEHVFCDNPVTDQFCNNFIFQVVGTGSQQINASRLDVFLTDEPSDTSTMNLIHWIQIVKSGKTQAFDFEDTKLNLQHYGQETPPLYNISQIGDVKIDLFWSEDDWIADTKDVEKLLRDLNPRVVDRVFKLDHFNHLDFVWGQRAAEEIYTRIIEDLKKHEN